MSWLRFKVVRLYKSLLHLGKEWPEGYAVFRDKCHNAFAKNKEETDPEKIKAHLRHGRFVAKEVEALYKLKKYRTMKKNYYDK